MSLIIENKGQDIVRTFFWETEMAKRGFLFLSSNAGAFRLLVPLTFGDIHEFQLAKDIIITRGFWERSKGDAMEILVNDGSDNPYSLHLSQSQLDRWPSSNDVGKTFVFTIWTNVSGNPFCSFKSECLYRVAEKLPYLKPR